MSRADDLQARAERFADAAVRFVIALPKAAVAQRFAGQLQNASTSVAANYRAARRSRSYAEFTARMAVVAEEADEAVFWLARMATAGVGDRAALEPLLREANELARIFGDAYRTARRRKAARARRT